MRPDFSVRHSPRLTKMNGVETRMAPPSMARRTMTRPIRRSSRARPCALEDGEAAVERLADQQDDEHQSLQHQHGGVGQAHAALDQAAGGVDAAEQDRDRDDGERVLAREEGDEDAGEAVAGGERGIGPALDRGDLEDSRRARRRRRRCAQETTISLPTGSPCARAARTLPPVMRAAKPNVVRFISTQSSDREHDADGEAPMHVECRESLPTMFASPIGVVDGLLGLAGIAQRALDEEVHDGDGDVGEQQAGDRLVDAAIVAQHADEADPDAADGRRGAAIMTGMVSQRRRPADERDGDRRGARSRRAPARPRRRS